MDEGGRLTAFLERPTEEERRAAPHPWVNSGLQMLNRSVLELIPSRVPADLPRDVYAPNINGDSGGGRFFGFPLTGYRCAIDSPARYAEADAAVRAGKWRVR
jgi:NDP-sugar pyrophosphorylase family protein